jgi:hypothetical protein
MSSSERLRALMDCAESSSPLLLPLDEDAEDMSAAVDAKFVDDAEEKPESVSMESRHRNRKTKKASRRRRSLKYDGDVLYWSDSFGFVDNVITGDGFLDFVVWLVSSFEDSSELPFTRTFTVAATDEVLSLTFPSDASGSNADDVADEDDDVSTTSTPLNLSIFEKTKCTICVNDALAVTRLTLFLDVK